LISVYSDRLRSEVRAVALGWFRDEAGRDRSVFAGMSVGNTMSCVLWQGISGIRHYVKKFQTPTRTDGIIEIPRDASRLCRMVAAEFGDVSDEQAATGQLQLDEQFIKLQMLKVPRSATLVRQLQRPLRPLVRRRTTLHITDWVTARASREDRKGLVLYRRSVLKSAIPYVSKTDRKTAEELFPDSIDDLLTYEVLDECLERQSFDWSPVERKLIIDYGRMIFAEIRPALVEATAQFLNMLDFYKPSKVHLPADAFEPWILLYQLCRQRGIETRMYIDGYMPLALWPALRDQDGLGWLVDRVAAYGTAQRTHVERTGFPPHRIDLVEAPFLKYLTTDQKDLFDVIVLTWIPYTVNPEADYSSPIRTLESALRVVKGLGFQRIAVKVKSDAEIGYVRLLLTHLDIEASILTGRFYQHVGSASLFVGGISTALAEVVAVNSRYVVFEPWGNGYTDALIDQSCVFSRESIARTEDDLRHLLESGASSWLGGKAQLAEPDV
jgi:hypothetical protein